MIIVLMNSNVISQVLGAFGMGKIKMSISTMPVKISNIDRLNKYITRGTARFSVILPLKCLFRYIYSRIKNIHKIKLKTAKINSIMYGGIFKAYIFDVNNL